LASLFLLLLFGCHVLVPVTRDVMFGFVFCVVYDCKWGSSCAMASSGEGTLA
jgi:hypothetical protein